MIYQRCPMTREDVIMLKRGQQMMSGRNSPFYESSLFWGCLSIVAAAFFTLFPTVTKDLRWLCIVAWPFAIIAIFVFSKTWTNTKIKYTIRAGGAVVSTTFLLYVYYLSPLSTQPAKSDLHSQKPPELFLAAEPGRLVLYNKEPRPILLWGTQFDGEAPSFEMSPRVIPRAGYYYLLDDRLRNWSEKNIGDNGELLVPLKVFPLTIEPQPVRGSGRALAGSPRRRWPVSRRLLSGRSGG